jgi:hypothetical protein
MRTSGPSIGKPAHQGNRALHEKGIEMDFSSITQLNDLTVEVEGKEKIPAYCA